MPNSETQTSSSPSARRPFAPVAEGLTVVVLVQLRVVGVTLQPDTIEVLVVAQERVGLSVHDIHTLVAVLVLHVFVIVAVWLRSSTPQPAMFAHVESTLDAVVAVT